MNKILCAVLSVLLCLAMGGCTKKDPPAVMPPTSSVPDMESIVEPLELEKTAIESDANADVESSAPSEILVVVSEPASQEAESKIAKPMPISESSTATSSKQDEKKPQQAPSKAEEKLNAIAQDTEFDREKVEKELLRLINAEREDVDAATLGMEDHMQFAARIRADEAMTKFSHTRPDNTPYNTAFDEADFTYAGKWHGENLSSLTFSEGMFTEKEAALEMFKGLKNSPGHYRNMVNEKFLQTGIGVAVISRDGNINIASAQLFASM